LPIRVNPRKEEKQMSKMGDMAATIEELRSAAAAINDAANWWRGVRRKEPGEKAPATALTLEK
jgi:hypothetical protein